jgi:hypothetical protein
MYPNQEVDRKHVVVNTLESVAVNYGEMPS